MKKFLSLVLASILLIGVLSGCGGGSTTTTPKNDTPAAPAATRDPNATDMGKGSTVEVGTKIDESKKDEVKYKDSLKVIVDNTQMSVLDPAHSSAGGQGTLLNVNCVFNTLIGNDNGTLVPELATSWEIDNNQHFTFHLRDDVYFHNGEKFTADDVAFTIEHAKEQKAGTAFTRYNYVESVDVIDDYTIVLNLTQPNSDFILYLHNPNLAILNRDAVEKDPEKGVWIGSGPWIVEEFVANEYSKLVRNDNYWGEPAKAKNLSFVKVNEEATRYMMLMNDEVDVAFGCSPADFDSIRDNPDFELYTYVICNVFYVGFNMQDPLMQDINFRKAIAYLINRDNIIWGTRYGYAAVPPSGSFWGYSTLYRNMDLPLLEYDPVKAKEYLDASSYNGEEVELSCWAVGEGIAQMLQAELLQLGVNATIFDTDNAGFGAHTKFGASQGQIICNGGNWNNYPSSAASFYADGSSTNKINIVNDKIVELFSTAMATTDEAEKEACYKEIQKISYDDFLYIPVISIEHGVGCPKGVGGMILTEENSHDLSGLFRVIE